MKRKNKRLQKLIHRLDPRQSRKRDDKISERHKKRTAPKVVEKK